MADSPCASAALPDIVDMAAANPAVGRHVDGVALMNALAALLWDEVNQ